MSRKLVRLRESGHFDGESKVSEDKARLDKQCLLVYAGKFESMDGPVEITDEDIEKLAANHNTFMSKLSRFASGEVHPRHNPPLQLDHSTSARDTIGRLVGDLTVGEHTLEDGSKVKSLMGIGRVLGRENVEKVEDGRWTHLSGGFDLDNHKVSELTITPFPAAAEAHMLSQKKVGAENLSTDPKLNLSAEDTMGMKELMEKAALYKKCKEHLTGHKAMSEEDAEKHLEKATDDELTAMSAEHDQHLSKLAEDEAKKKEEEEHLKAQFTAHKPALVKLGASVKALSGKSNLAVKTSKIGARLAKLRAEAKVTPGEIKDLNITKLAEKSDEAVEAALSSYDKRAPVVDTGLIGSTKAMTPGQLAVRLKKMNMEREELQTRLNMPMKAEAARKRLAEIDEQEKKLGEQGVMEPHHQEPDGDEHFEAAYMEHQRLTQEGKVDEAKEHLRSYMKSLGMRSMGESHNPVDQTAAMSALAGDVKSMQNDFVAFVKLTAPAFGATIEELT